jgi:non-heme chloroperoxidase
MGMITVGKENSTAIDLYYEDHGTGTPWCSSDRVLEENWNVAAGASAIGTLQCVDAWVEDFRKDIAKNTVPTLIIHGDADRILPPDATSRRQAKMIKHVTFAEIAGGPHGLCWTHADRVNAELVPFVE